MDFGYILEQEIMRFATKLNYVDEEEEGIKVMFMFWA